MVATVAMEREGGPTDRAGTFALFAFFALKMVSRVRS